LLRVSLDLSVGSHLHEVTHQASTVGAVGAFPPLPSTIQRSDDWTDDCASGADDVASGPTLRKLRFQMIDDSDHVIEIQTGNFASIKRKMRDLSCRYRVTLVYPVAHERWILEVPGTLQGAIMRRKSPKRQAVNQLFEELVSFPDLSLLKSPSALWALKLTSDETIFQESCVNSSSLSCIRFLADFCLAPDCIWRSSLFGSSLASFNGKVLCVSD